MEAALGNSKDYSLKQYLLFADKLQTKAKVGECLLLIDVRMCLMREKDWKYLLAVINALYEARALLDCNNQLLLFVSLLY
jgi:hypothetical protein